MGHTYRSSADRGARRLVDGVGTFRGPLLPTKRRDPGVPMSLEHWVGFAAIAVAHSIEERYARALYEAGVSLRDFVVLAEVARLPGLTQSALAERVGLGRSRLSEQLAVLETAGYVDRDISRLDLRCRTVHPSFNGQEMVEFASALLHEADSGLLSALPPSERHAFTAGLRRLPPARTARFGGFW